MARETFDKELQEVKNELLLLGNMVEDAVMKSVDALRDNNVERSRLLLANDVYINRKRYETELLIIILIATRQPTANNMRLLTASLSICTELERIGDYAKGIANINIRSEGLSLPKLLSEIYFMAEKSTDILHRAMIAYSEEDDRAAWAIIPEDNVIDEYYFKLYNEAVNTILDDARNLERSNYVIWAAHNLERMGDRVVNICERVIYIATGERLEISTSVFDKVMLGTGN
jgi:phosphate transport system protein